MVRVHAFPGPVTHSCSVDHAHFWVTTETKYERKIVLSAKWIPIRTQIMALCYTHSLLTVSFRFLHKRPILSICICLEQ